MNLFVVETPLQLLNAHEARQYFGVTDAHLVLLLSPSYRYDAFAPLLDDVWKSVRPFVIRIRADDHESGIPDDQLSSWRILRKLLRQMRRRALLERVVRSYVPVERIFLGNYLIDYMRHIGHAVPHRELVVLDDGTDTLRVNEQRHQPATTVAAVPDRGPIGRVRSSLRTSYLEWDLRPAPALVFFSTYNLRLRSGDRLLQHQYGCLRERIGKQSADDSIFFLGQPLSGDGYLTEDAYLEALKGVKRYFVGQSVVYVPHPREGEGGVARVAHAVGLAIRRFDVPIEIVIAWRGVRPRVLASFFCSALENCSVLCGSDIPIKAFRLAERDLLCCHDDVNRVYDHFLTNTNGHVEVVNLA